MLFVFITDEQFCVVIGKQRTGSEEKRKQHRRSEAGRRRENGREATGDCA